MLYAGYREETNDAFMKNQTQIFSFKGLTSPTSGIPNVNHYVNAFVASGLASGFTNFEIKEMVVTTEYNVGGLPTGDNWYTVQVNFNDPALY